MTKAKTSLAIKEATLKKWTSLSDFTQRLAKTISAIVVVFGAVTAVGGWIIGQINSSTEQRINAITEMYSQDLIDLKQSTMRTELQLLIIHSPEDKVSIEMMAREYFLTLGGNHYMKSVYAKWADEYGGDRSFLVNN